jgi:hypothetical protein
MRFLLTAWNRAFGDDEPEYTSDMIKKTNRREANMMYAREIEANIQKLPPHLRSSVLDYVEFLLNKYTDTKPKRGKFKFDWEGELSDLAREFSSVELQHKALEWR